MPTLSDARTFLSRYAGQNNSLVDRLNFVIARLLPEVNSKGTKVPVRFAVYIDNAGNRVVTLPRGLETILAGAYQSPVMTGATGATGATGTQWYWCGRPIPIRNDYYEFVSNGPGDFAGSDWQRGIIPLQGRFTTFADWNTAMKLRVKLEQTENNGRIVFKGALANQKIWSTYDGGWNEGVELVFTNATATTTQQFDLPPYEIVKTVTKGRVRIYAVDPDTDAETLVSYLDPDETNPSYRRFKIPVCQATAP